MIIEREIKIMIPNGELGYLIARKPPETQAKILQGFANGQLEGCAEHIQPIISLVAMLTNETRFWLKLVAKQIEIEKTK